MRRSASSIEMSGGPVTSRSTGVMNSSTGRSSCAALHGQSRFERSPARTPLPGASSIRRPVTLCRRASSRASRTLLPRARQKGRSTTWPWVRLTRATSAAWAAIGSPRCTKPSPPSSAIATAIRASVTLSMLAETRGSSRVSRRVSRVPSGDLAPRGERARLGAEQEVVVRPADELRLEGPAHVRLRPERSMRARPRTGRSLLQEDSRLGYHAARAAADPRRACPRHPARRVAP